LGVAPFSRKRGKRPSGAINLGQKPWSKGKRALGRIKKRVPQGRGKVQGEGRRKGKEVLSHCDAEKLGRQCCVEEIN